MAGAAKIRGQSRAAGLPLRAEHTEGCPGAGRDGGEARGGGWGGCSEMQRSKRATRKTTVVTRGCEMPARSLSLSSQRLPRPSPRRPLPRAHPASPLPHRPHLGSLSSYSQVSGRECGRGRWGMATVSPVRAGPSAHLPLLPAWEGRVTRLGRE